MLNRYSLSACALGAVLALGSTHVAIGQQAADELHQLFADEWNNRLERDPLFASSRGVTDYNDRLPDMTATALQRAREEDQQFLERLEAINQNTLSPEDQTNYDLFEFVVGHRAILAQYRTYRTSKMWRATFST